MVKLKTLASPRGAMFTSERRFIFLVSRRNINIKINKAYFWARSSTSLKKSRLLGNSALYIVSKTR